MSCSRTQHSGESLSSNPSIHSLPFYKMSHWAPQLYNSIEGQKYTHNIELSYLVMLKFWLKINYSFKRIPGHKIILCVFFMLYSAELIMLIKVKMPTIVGILMFMNMISTTSESLKARKLFIFQHKSFNEQLKFHAQMSWESKSFITSGPGPLWFLSFQHYFSALHSP